MFINLETDFDSVNYNDLLACVLLINPYTSIIALSTKKDLISFTIMGISISSPSNIAPLSKGNEFRSSSIYIHIYIINSGILNLKKTVSAYRISFDSERSSNRDIYFFTKYTRIFCIQAKY